MIHIRKIKTLYGLRYAVVSPMRVYTRDEKGNESSRIEHFSVEYQSGSNKRDLSPAIFPLTKDGLRKAKEVQKLFKVNK